MDQTVIQWLVGQAGMGGLAAFALIMLRQSYIEQVGVRKEQVERERAIAEERRVDRDTILSALKSNTEAVVKLTSIVERTNDLSEGCELAQMARIKERQKN